MTFIVRSSSFAEGGDIPAAHTCDGANTPPPLSWENPPEGTKSYALIVDDPDAPNPAAPKSVWVHWIVYNLPASTKELGLVPREAKEGLNDFGRVGYRGPCPPVGRHRYFFKLYALDTRLPERDNATKAQIEQAMVGHILEETRLLGYYRH